MQEITLIAAFTAGLASVLSPCFLPLIPAFVSYLGGVGLEGKMDYHTRDKTMLNTGFFALGFIVVFSVLGVALNGALSSISAQLMDAISKLAGLAIIFFGFSVLGIIKLGILEKERKLAPKKTRYAYLTSFVFGAAFAISWSPCVGVLLAAIFFLAATQPGGAFILLFLYSLGLAVPFLAVGWFTAEASGFIKSHAKTFWYFNRLMGVVLVIIGLLVLTGNFSQLSSLSLSKCVGIG